MGVSNNSVPQANGALDPHLLWELMPKVLPGKLSMETNKTTGAVGYVVRPVGDVCYPDGSPMTEIACRNLLARPPSNLVLFSLADASDSDRKRQNQPFLMEAVEIREASQSQIDAAVKQIKEVREHWLAADLQKRIRSVDKQIEDEKERLRKQAEQQAIEAKKAVEARIAELDRQRGTLDLQRRKLDEREGKLEKREAGLQSEVDRLVGAMVGVRELDLRTREEAVKLDEGRTEKDKKWLSEQQAQLQGERDQLTRDLARFKIEGGAAFAAALARLDEPEAEAPCEPLPDDCPPPSDLIDRLTKSIKTDGYTASSELITRFLLSTCVAACTGQFVVLTGPTGVGKTSLINVMASAVGAGSGTVPVRPAWLDPTDLLGFYNPQCGRFQPTPFMDRLLQAQRWAGANRLYLLCLDEMNLSRVENYAADFLALLEKARAGLPDAQLSLYAKEVEQQLAREARRLQQREDGAEEFWSLMAHLERYPARKEIPPNLVLYGTINVDESTHMLSPKFLDRSLVTQITHPTLGKELPTPAAERAIKTVWGLGLAATRQMSIAELSEEESKAAGRIWQDFVSWQKFYGLLGIRPGYRFAQVFNAYLRCAASLHVKPEQAANAFFHAKLLPCVSFHRDENAVGQANVKKLAVLREWADAVEARRYNGEEGLRATLQRLASREAPVISYLE